MSIAPSPAHPVLFLLSRRFFLILLWGSNPSTPLLFSWTKGCIRGWASNWRSKNAENYDIVYLYRLFIKRSIFLLLILRLVTLFAVVFALFCNLFMILITANLLRLVFVIWKRIWLRIPSTFSFLLLQFFVRLFVFDECKERWSAHIKASSE